MVKKKVEKNMVPIPLKYTQDNDGLLTPRKGEGLQSQFSG